MSVPAKKPWAILLCKFADDENDPHRTRISDLYSHWVSQHGQAVVDNWIIRFKASMAAHREIFHHSGLEILDRSGMENRIRFSYAYVETLPGITTRRGLYDIPNLPPATYRVVVQKFAFRTVVTPDVEMHVQDVIALDFTLELESRTSPTAASARGCN